MRSITIVGLDPGLQGAEAVVVGVIERGVGPFFEHRAVEPLHLAVDLGPAGRDQQVADPEFTQELLDPG